MIQQITTLMNKRRRSKSARKPSREMDANVFSTFLSEELSHLLTVVLRSDVITLKVRCRLFDCHIFATLPNNAERSSNALAKAGIV